ncbi:YqeG family HAD IIIA-type phosphatase [Bhargavaea ullalensis]|uniref:YqeG family HAD IIIA-type phosphatase n=1 Tax=Bhargavaea ullalensis TaxID=1265685 RepID=UPI0033989D19
MYRHFLPSEYVKNVFRVTPEKLKENGIRGIITDLDNTLVEWDRPDATKEIIEWAEELKKAGIRVTIVSNNNEGRVKAFADPLGIPFIHKARKPMGRAFRQAVRQMGMEKDEVAVIGDQLMTDIFGGNRSGLHTILVVPVSSKDGFITKFNRQVERRIMKKLKRQGLLDWEDVK